MIESKSRFMHNSRRFHHDFQIFDSKKCHYSICMSEKNFRHRSKSEYWSRASPKSFIFQLVKNRLSRTRKMAELPVPPNNLPLFIKNILKSNLDDTGENSKLEQRRSCTKMCTASRWFDTYSSHQKKIA